MARHPRISVGNTIYHVLNRSNGKAQIFFTDADYQSFESILEDSLQNTRMRILSYVIMPNHWHLILYPYEDGDLSRYVKLVTETHAARLRRKTDTIGTGHVYQGRFKSFQIQHDRHFIAVARYVEANPFRADLVSKVGHWKWSSFWRREFGNAKQKKLLSNWPVERPPNFHKMVTIGLNEEDVSEIKHSIEKNMPFGDDHWKRKHNIKTQK